MYGDPGLNSPELQWHIRTYLVLQFQNPFLRQFLGSFDQNQVKFLLDNKIKLKYNLCYEVLNAQRNVSNPVLSGVFPSRDLVKKSLGFLDSSHKNSDCLELKGSWSSLKITVLFLSDHANYSHA